MPLFRKKPVVVEAVQFTGTRGSAHGIIQWINRENPEFDMEDDDTWRIISYRYGTLTIRTLEGEMTAAKGDWIVRGVKGEFYPCKADIFALLYDPIEPGTETKEV